MLDAMRDTDVPASAPAAATAPPAGRRPPSPVESRSRSLEDLLASYSEIKVTRPNIPVPFVPPEDPANGPLFLPVRSRKLCWRCGREVRPCTCPPILFCSRCGGLDRLSRTCPCWFTEEDRQMLPPPRIVPERDRLVSRGIQYDLGREIFRSRFPDEVRTSRSRVRSPRQVHWTPPDRWGSVGRGAVREESDRE